MNNVNPFVKVRQFLKSCLDDCEEQLNDLLEQYRMKDYADGIVWQNVKTGEEIELDLNAGKSPTKNPLKKLFNYIVRKKIDKIQKKANECLEEAIKSVNRNIVSIKDRMSYFSINGYAKTIDSLPQFVANILAMGNHIGLSLEEIKLLISLAIRKNYEYYSNNLKAQREINSSNDINKINELKYCLKLGTYFDKKGRIVANDDIDTFENSFLILFDSIDVSSMKEYVANSSNKFFNIQEIVDSFVNSLCMKKLTQKELEDNRLQLQKERIDREKKCQESIKLSRVAMQLKKIALNELEQYYKDGVIVKEYSNIEEFRSLLLKCDFNDEQINKIMRLMIRYNTHDVTDKRFREYLSESDYTLLVSARKESNEGILFYVSEVECSITLLNETSGVEERQYLEKYINENLVNLKCALGTKCSDVITLEYKKA